MSAINRNSPVSFTTIPRFLNRRQLRAARARAALEGELSARATPTRKADGSPARTSDSPVEFTQEKVGQVARNEISKPKPTRRPKKFILSKVYFFKNYDFCYLKDENDLEWALDTFVQEMRKDEKVQFNIDDKMVIENKISLKRILPFSLELIRRDIVNVYFSFLLGEGEEETRVFSFYDFTGSNKCNRIKGVVSQVLEKSFCADNKLDIETYWPKESRLKKTVIYVKNHVRNIFRG